ncbi:hypothetical protein [Chroococcus sp. FPU101]|uniref:hypothetical protein n=1 Tax=Chroococcus sp. FPU101 TaxID=1974212 RepID=UPI001A8DF04D|nr:hypothetical protein [Chroococcus sp. FPU101]GFE68588.1 hypothetical protein CFPU101_11980 [Chroococcus sp. FPU101]
MADLSGTWLGTFEQDNQPTRFELILVQGGNTLSGSVLDDGYMGEATLVGQIIGRRISFTKRYLNRSYYTVEYTGIVSEDENAMQGNWNILNRHFGTWEAHRGGDNLSLELSKVISQKVPMGVSSIVNLHQGTTAT